MEWRRYEFNPSMSDMMIGPDAPDACPDGWESHTWQVSIEEHQVVLSTDECSVCSRGIHNGSLDDCIEMAPINVTLKFDTDCSNDELGGWHYDQRCDCDWWWTLTPSKYPKVNDGGDQ